MRSLLFVKSFIVYLLLSVSSLFANDAALETSRWHVRGPESKGGLVDIFLANIEHYRERNITVVLEGECWSSCTLYTALLRHNLLCATSGTKLVFHQYVWVNNENMRVGEGGVLESFIASGPAPASVMAKVRSAYPKHVMTVINSYGGLPPHGQELFISAEELGIPRC